MPIVKSSPCVAFAALCLAGAQASASEAPRVVAELFTSLGCSSCPPADAMAGRLSADARVLVLSYHVNYWDGLGWKDPFSSQASTDRQYAYAHSLGKRTVFTPQLIVNGTRSLVVSRESLLPVVEEASRSDLPVQARLQRGPDGGIALTLEGTATHAQVREIRYVRHAATAVPGGENRGRTVDTYNNVTHVRSLGTFAPGTLQLPALRPPDDGLAVIIQSPEGGPILGAAKWSG